MRTATIKRQTRETDIALTLALDGTGQYQIETGIGFLDHMLTLLAGHGLFDLTIEAKGDLHVDQHHTVEDVAIVLGQAFSQALGDRNGIVCVGSAFVPMDEALVLVVVDLSGPPRAVATVERTNRGPLLLFSHFLKSFAVGARANVHARVLYGSDNHHKIEGLFKALGRALDTATRLDPRRAGRG
jgi:imidazoleglycerol-phosphate dehydratase